MCIRDSVNAESEEFLNEGKIQDILDKYAKFLPVPIKSVSYTHLDVYKRQAS